MKNNAGPLGQDAVATLTRRALVPKSPEVFVHDADGNLTADGQWSYTWDAENRLVAVETLPALVAPDGPLPADRKRRLEYLYDAQHRRIARKAYSWSASSGSWILGSEFRYLYDGWNVIAEFAFVSSTSTFNLNSSYAWGLDLSGTLQGAGGVGGLVFARLHNGAASVTHAAAADGNGNVLAYYDAATGERTARFEYGPFGEPLVDDGVAAESLTYRFSTKPRDPLTGTYYYGYRHYVPTTGRWLNRDPIEEEGGANLYGFVGNDGINVVDLLGESGWVVPRFVPRYVPRFGPRYWPKPNGPRPTPKPTPSPGQKPQPSPWPYPVPPINGPQAEPDPDYSNHYGKFDANWCNVEKTVAWGQPTPLTKKQALALLDNLESMLAKSIIRDLRPAFEKARAFIRSRGERGITAPPPYIRSWKIPGTKGDRVDVEVHGGRAFSDDGLRFPPPNDPLLNPEII